MISDSSRCHTAEEQPWNSDASVLPSPSPSGALPRRLSALPTPSPDTGLASWGACCSVVVVVLLAVAGGRRVSTMMPPSQPE